MPEDERQRYLLENFGGKYPNHLLGRESLTPISEKDTIYEQTHKGTIMSGNIGVGVSPHKKLQYTPEEHKKTQMSTPSMSDERKLTGTGQYKLPSPSEEDDDYYEEDFEDVSYIILILFIV